MGRRKGKYEKKEKRRNGRMRGRFWVWTYASGETDSGISPARLAVEGRDLSKLGKVLAERGWVVDVFRNILYVEGLRRLVTQRLLVGGAC